MSSKSIEAAYRLASERYSELGVDVDSALARLATIPISLHCWQGDDVAGFENAGGELGGGLAVTGNYPGKARTPDELRSDVDKAFSLLPGKHRFNLHAIYGESTSRPAERDRLEPAHFRGWIDWAKERHIGLDFNPTCFSHPKAADGFTLAHPDAAIRRFWIDHCISCRRIGATIGRELGTPCVTNIWIPDGFKDTPVDRRGPRERLLQSLDEVLAESIDPALEIDAVEGKLFGLGVESYTVGSHELYLGYAVKKQLVLCLDAGHFHPTETLADKISSLMMFLPGILLHASRGVRWDSDHVVILSDDLEALAQELVRGDYLGRAHLALDFFDASIHRVAAWVVGARALLKALLLALVEPIAQLRRFEREGSLTARLALLEEAKTLPFGAVWDYYCLRHDVPVGMDWMDDVERYDAEVTRRRSIPVPAGAGT